MRKIPTLSATSISFAVSLLLSGCSSKPEVIAVQKPYYQGYPSLSVPLAYQRTTASPRQPIPGLAPPTGSYRDSRNAGGSPTSLQQTRTVSHTPSPVPHHDTMVAADEIYKQVRVRRDYLPMRARGRTGKSMNPRYITIHSTQNWSRGADAWRHSLALKRSKLGRLSWHYTIDENVAVQHLPTREQGSHADFDGPGNRYSIGLEMCEHPGNSRKATIERTARLTAWLMYKHDIPLSRVVPHYHWPRWGKNPPHKNCPHFLLDNGKPGRKWKAYLAKVKSYRDQISSPRTDNWAVR